MDNSDLSTDNVQREWFVDMNSETQVVASTDGNEQSSEVEGAPVVKEKVVLKRDDKVAFRETDTDQWKEATVLSRGGKATGKYPGYLMYG